MTEEGNSAPSGERRPQHRRDLPSRASRAGNERHDADRCRFHANQVYIENVSAGPDTLQVVVSTGTDGATRTGLVMKDVYLADGGTQIFGQLSEKLLEQLVAQDRARVLLCRGE